MATGEDNRHNSNPSISNVSSDSHLFGGEGDLSPEDLAWVDSCLVKNAADISTLDLTSLTDSLLDILSLQPREEPRQPSSSSLDQTNGHLEPTPPHIAMEVSASSSGDPFVAVSNSNDLAVIENDVPPTFEGESGFALPSLTTISAFLPHYKEDDESAIGPLGSTLDNLSFLSMEGSTEDIFKVWDLGIEDDDEEDELVKQLNKALSESSPLDLVPAIESEAVKDLKELSLDNLVSGIADLSLDQRSF